MAEFKYAYKDMTERAQKIAEAEGLGLMMLHDDFDNPNWKRGEPIVGVLTFTNEILPSPEPKPPARDYDAEIDALKARIEKLEKNARFRY